MKYIYQFIILFSLLLLTSYKGDAPTMPSYEVSVVIEGKNINIELLQDGDDRYLIICDDKSCNKVKMCKQ